MKSSQILLKLNNYSLINEIIYILLFISLNINYCISWGKEGHILTARIAQRLLSNTTQKEVYELLNSHDLGEIANWADHIRSYEEWKWSQRLHYINTPNWECKYNQQLDCPFDQFDISLLLKKLNNNNDQNDILNQVQNSNTPSNYDGFCFNVDGAIQNYTFRLLDLSLSRNDHIEGLKFLVHFIGDIHQPLHVAFKSDEGGNLITGQFLEHSYNLHSIWDDVLIKHRMAINYKNDYAEYEATLISMLQNEYIQKLIQNSVKCETKIYDNKWSNSDKFGNFDLTSVDDDQIFEKLTVLLFSYNLIKSNLSTIVCSSEWASESAKIACSDAYVLEDGKTQIQNHFHLNEMYYEKTISIVEQQLFKGAARLANTLNWIFDNRKLLHQSKQKNEIPYQILSK